MISLILALALMGGPADSSCTTFTQKCCITYCVPKNGLGVAIEKSGDGTVIRTTSSTLNNYDVECVFSSGHYRGKVYCVGPIYSLIYVPRSPEIPITPIRSTPLTASDEVRVITRSTILQGKPNTFHAPFGCPILCGDNLVGFTLDGSEDYFLPLVNGVDTSFKPGPAPPPPETGPPRPDPAPDFKKLIDDLKSKQGEADAVINKLKTLEANLPDGDKLKGIIDNLVKADEVAKKVLTNPIVETVAPGLLATLGPWGWIAAAALGVGGLLWKFGGKIKVPGTKPPTPGPTNPAPGPGPGTNPPVSGTPVPGPGTPAPTTSVGVPVLQDHYVQVNVDNTKDALDWALAQIQSRPGGAQWAETTRSLVSQFGTPQPLSKKAN